jgi:hypothetical protein
VLVSGYELARHSGCSRQNVELLATQGVSSEAATASSIEMCAG